MKIYAVIDTNVIISALLSRHQDSATVKVLDYLYDRTIVPVYNDEILEEYGELGLEFLQGNQNTLSDFKVGLIIPTGKLLPKHINGGIVLVDSPYKVREKLLT